MTRKEVRNKLDPFFDILGTIKEKLQNYLYLIKVNGKNFKRRHNQLKLSSVGKRGVED